METVPQTKTIVYKGKEKIIPLHNPDKNNCEFFILPKFRYCHFQKYNNTDYCVYHTPNDKEEFLICPYDKKHRILKSKYKAHLKTCNVLQARKEYEAQKWFSKEINHAKDPKGYINQEELNKFYEMKWDDLSDSEYEAMLDKVLSTYNTLKEMYLSYVKENNIDSIVAQLNKDINSEIKFAISGVSVDTETDLKSTSQLIHSQKHSIQNKALALLAVKSNLINDSNILVVEFGAGKGGLSKSINEIQGKTIINVLLERQGMRHKKEAKVDSMVRYRTDIIDFNLNYLYDNMKDINIENKEKVKLYSDNKDKVDIVGVAKHICGCAFDLSLSCLFNYCKFSSNVKGVCMATCCHHICRVELLNHLDFYVEKLNMSIKEIVFLFKATSWIFGSISNKNNVPKHEEIFTKKNTSRKYIGLISKYTVDLARVMCLINKGFKVCYIKYCDNGVTTENNVILAMKNK